MSDCPERAELLGLLDSDDPHITPELRAHVDECARCTELLEESAEILQLAGAAVCFEAGAGAQVPPLVAEQSLQAVLARRARQKQPAATATVVGSGSGEGFVREPPSIESGWARQVSTPQFVDELVALGILPREAKADLADLAEGGGAVSVDSIVDRLVAAGRLTTFQAEAVRHGNHGKLVVGDYSLLEVIGSGGMGRIYKARHRHMGRLVALKVQRGTSVDPIEAAQRFQQEVQAAARLSHPNIVTAYDAGFANGEPYLVMEYVDGRPLSDIIFHRDRLEVRTAVDYILQAARGLAYAHSRGIVHRDIKPGNLLVDRGGVVKILDMGLARVETGEGCGITETGEILGTVDYMAPEQAEDTRAADGRADIYSLGCTLYHCLTGAIPFEGRSQFDKIVAHREKSIPSIRSRRPLVPPRLEEIFARMVAKNPGERFATMQDVIKDLEALLGEMRGPARWPGQSGTCPGAASAGASLQSSPGHPVAEVEACEPGAETRTDTAPTEQAPSERSPFEGAAASTMTFPASSPDSSLETRDEPPSPAEEKAETAAESDERRQTLRPSRLWPVMLAAGILLAAGIVVIIRNKEGKEVGRVEIGEGQSVEIRTKGGADPEDRAGRPELRFPVRQPPPATPPDGASQRDIVVWVTQLGGSVGVRSGRRDLEVFDPQDLPSGVFDITRVDLREVQGFADEAFEQITKLPELDSLYLGESAVTDAALPRIGRVEKLKVLDLRKTPVTDEGIAHVANLRNLEWLNLSYTEVTDEGLSRLTGLTELTLIRLEETKTTDKGIAHLAHLPNLESLHAQRTGLTDAGLAKLKTLSRLTELNVEGTQVSDEGVAAFRQAIPGCKVVK